MKEKKLQVIPENLFRNMQHTLIIAEAGVNHNGDINLAKKLIDVAAEAGADYVKFQTFKAEKIVSPLAKKAEYQKSNMTQDKADTQFEMLKKLELSVQDHELLIEYCNKKNIRFLSTAFDLDSIDLLHSFGIDLFKIPSGEITNLPYLRKVAKIGAPVILSTGMSTLPEVESALQILIDNGLDKNSIILLHCTTEYPTPMEDVNLNAMKTMADKFNVRVGYSDHTMGIEVPIAAAALGACVIEKHFTLDRGMTGPDHKASLEPKEFAEMVRAIRNIEKALGEGTKEVASSERKNIAIARKSIVAAVEIKEGELFTENNLTTKRPGTGVSPMLWDTVVGTKAKKEYQPDDLIEL